MNHQKHSNNNNNVPLVEVDECVYVCSKVSALPPTLGPYSKQRVSFFSYFFSLFVNQTCVNQHKLSLFLSHTRP
jgi:hypothetical protein